jgi:hypothetical protein
MILDDGGDATLLMHLGAQAEKDIKVLAKPGSEEETLPVRRHQGQAQGGPDLVQPPPEAHHRRDRRNHHRRVAPERNVGQGHAVAARDQRQRFGHQEQVRQPVWLPRVAGGRHQARHRRDDRRQGGRGGRLRRRGQGLRPGPARAERPGVGDRDRPDQRPAGRDGRLQGRDHGICRRQGRHLRVGHRQQERDHLQAHGRHEGPGHRLQHRPLRQRDRRRFAVQVQVGRDQAPGGPCDLPEAKGKNGRPSASSCWPRAAW